VVFVSEKSESQTGSSFLEYRDAFFTNHYCQFCIPGRSSFAWYLFGDPQPAQPCRLVAGTNSLVDSGTISKFAASAYSTE
jgi:hypothetical protein